jgi:hypothetical protein
MKTNKKYKQSRNKMLIGMSIIAPALWCLTVGVSFADNTNTPPAKGSQKALAVNPQKNQAVKSSAPSTTKSYPEETGFNISGEGLTEKPSTVEGGGVELDLQGRFRSPRTATIGPDGKVHIGHEPHDKITGKKNKE